MVRHLTAIALSFGLMVSPVAATSQSSQTQDEINATLGADEWLWNGLFVLALGDQIRTVCPTIEARTFRATAFVYELYSHARSYGYSRQQLRAFQVADSTEARMRADVLEYFDEHGVQVDVAETYCALGEAEIAADTPVGRLLRAR